MRTILLLALLLVLFGTVAATVPGSEEEVATTGTVTPTLEWVRTRDGWERPIDWVPPLRNHATMHPFVVASFLGLSSLLVLVAPTSRPPSS